MKDILAKQKSLAHLILFALLMGFLTNGCISSDQDIATTSTGNIRVSMTDDPFPFDTVARAHLTISRIEAQSANGQTMTLTEQVSQIELTQLRNGTTLTMVDMKIPSGDYDQLRLFISDASVDLTDGRHFNMVVPSGASSGLKIKLQPTLHVAANKTADLLIDFDMSRSFVAQGNAHSAQNITGFHFHPVIRATNLEFAGALMGHVMSNQDTAGDQSDDTPLSGVDVSLQQNGVEVATAVTDSEGFYKIIGLRPGYYDVVVTATNYVSDSLSNIAIVADLTSTTDFLLRH